MTMATETNCGAVVTRRRAVMTVSEDTVDSGRRLAVDLLRHEDKDLQFAASLLLGEALTNVWMHGEPGELDLRMALGRTATGWPALCMRLDYPTQWFSSFPPRPDELAESGRGIWIMRAMSTRISYKFRPGRVRLRIVIVYGDR